MREANNKFKQLRALRKNTDMSLQQFINEAYQILGNPIILYDIDWKILACAQGVVTDDPIWNSHINTGTVTYDNEATEIFKNEGFIEMMTRPDQVVLLSGEKVRYDRFFGKIYDEGRLPIACVSVIDSDKLFDDDDLMLTETICKMLSKEILKIPYYQNYAQRKLETYINRLIDGDTRDKIYRSVYIDIVYIGLKDNLYIAVADIAQCDPSYSKLTYYRDLFKQTRPAFKYSVYSNYIVFIMSTAEEAFHPQRCFNRLNRIFEENHIKVGISSRFENLFDLKQYYMEAVDALESGLKSNSAQRIFLA